MLALVIASLAMTFWPQNLAVLYPNLPGMWNFWQVIEALALPVAVSTLVIVLVTWVVYYLVKDFQFIDFDNLRVLTGLSWENVVWAFTTGHQTTWLSPMLDIELYDVDAPGGHHITNVIRDNMERHLRWAVMVAQDHTIGYNNLDQKGHPVAAVDHGRVMDELF